MSYPYHTSPLEGLMRGFQIRAMIDDIKYRREARAQQAQLHQLELQRYQNDEARKNFATALTLSQMGAIPSSPGQEQAMQGLTDALGPPTPESARTPVDVPMGGTTKTYRLPSQLDRYALAKTQAQQEGNLEAIKQTAFQAGTAEAGIPVKYPAIGDQPSITVNVPKSQYGAAIKTLRELQDGSTFSAHSFETDDQGNVNFVGIPKGGGQPKVVPLGPIGKTKPPKEMSDAEQRARATVKARARLAQEFTGPKLKEIEDSYAGGLYQTYAQQEGIDWQYEQEAKGLARGSTGVLLPADPEKAKHVAQVQARARAAAHDIVQSDLAKKEAEYIDEEVAGGGGTARNAVPVSTTLSESQQRMQTALGNYRKMTADQKKQTKNGVTPRQWFLKTFGVDPDTIQ